MIMKRFIRWLYWTFAHKGDAWQARLVVYHLGNVIKVGENVSTGDIVLAQINKGLLEKVGEVSIPFGLTSLSFLKEVKNEDNL